MGMATDTAAQMLPRTSWKEQMAAGTGSRSRFWAANGKAVRVGQIGLLIGSGTVLLEMNSASERGTT
jgi:hypothetical protein